MKIYEDGVNIEDSECFKANNRKGARVNIL